MPRKKINNTIRLCAAALSLLCVCLLSSCACQKSTKELVALAGRRIPLHIEMPANKLVFENLSPLVYDALWNHFDRVGFDLVEKEPGSNCHCLKVKIKKVDSPYKYLSPDLLSYAVKMKIELECKLFDKDDKLCAKKVFYFSALISKAKDFVLNSSFIDFEYRKMLERNVHRIDHYFRPFLLKDGF